MLDLDRSYTQSFVGTVPKVRQKLHRERPGEPYNDLVVWAKEEITALQSACGATAVLVVLSGNKRSQSVHITQLAPDWIEKENPDDHPTTTVSTTLV